MKVFLLCLKIFCCRILDVSFLTLRTIATVKRKNIIASILGFFEVFIWFLVVKDALNTQLTSIFIPLSYAGGYAMGTFVGGQLSNLISKPKVNMQIITTSKDRKIIENLKEFGCPMTVLDAFGGFDQWEKYLIYIEVEDKYQNKIREKVHELDPNAFIMVNDITPYKGYTYSNKNDK